MLSLWRSTTWLNINSVAKYCYVKIHFLVFGWRYTFASYLSFFLFSQRFVLLCFTIEWSKSTKPFSYLYKASSMYPLQRKGGKRREQENALIGLLWKRQRISSWPSRNSNTLFQFRKRSTKHPNLENKAPKLETHLHFKNMRQSLIKWTMLLIEPESSTRTNRMQFKTIYVELLGVAKRVV